MPNRQPDVTVRLLDLAMSSTTIVDDIHGALMAWRHRDISRTEFQLRGVQIHADSLQKMAEFIMQQMVEEQESNEGDKNEDKEIK